MGGFNTQTQQNRNKPNTSNTNINPGGDPNAALKNRIRDRLRNPAGDRSNFERLGNIERGVQAQGGPSTPKSRQQDALKAAIRQRLAQRGNSRPLERLGNIERSGQLAADARKEKAKQKVAGAVRSALGGAAAGAIASKALGIGSLSRRKGAPGSLV